MAKKFVNLDNLEHVIEKHDRDVQGLNDALQKIDAKVDKVIFGEVGEDVATSSLRRDTGVDFGEHYNKENTKTAGGAAAGVYATLEEDEDGNMKTVHHFAFKIPQGKQGVQGPQGQPGVQGEKGEKGEMGEPYYNRYVMAFCHCDHDDYDKPTISDIAGTWVPSEDDVAIYDPHDKFIWFLSDETLEPPIWMAHGHVVKDFKDDPKNPIPIKWNSVMQITGDKGEMGKDGAAIEFIYKRTKTSLEAPSIPDNDPNIDDFIPDGWSDHPEGIDETMQCEWMCSRLYKESGRWGAWNETTDADGNFIPGVPVIFSKWGERGIDGDGVQYIYQRTKENILPTEDPTPNDYITNTDYQNKYNEYCPEGWSDDPSGVGDEYKYEWVWVRKYKGVDQKWGPFEGPRLWANWSKDGSDGIPGVRYEARYYKVVGGSQFPTAAKPSDKMNINLPTGWQSSLPPYNADNDTVWVIYAYVNYKNEMATTADGLDEEICGWSEPALLSAINGKDAIAPNYKTYAYKQSDTKPSKPTSNDPKNPGDGWVDIPTSEGQWWQCIGSVNGVTELVIEWSEVMQVNGKDGVAQDGNHIEMRFGVGVSAPSVSKSDRNPGPGWSLQPVTPSENQYLWMIMATINPNDTLDGEWSTPVRISGERGPQGATGPTGEPGSPGVNGSDGIPGVSFESQYCLGTETAADGSWQDTVPTITAEKQYIWMRQGKRVYSSASDTTGTVSWFDENGFRLSGLNSANSDSEARKGQIVYPAGVYSVNNSYTTDEFTAPYVLDSSDGNFYVLNAIMTWKGTEQSNYTPAQDYNNNGGKYWQQFKSFEAVYAKVGIIANGLIGSAVFNGDYMFSQQGITKSGAATSDYQSFNARDPYKSTNSFRPNFCVNFKTGEVWASAGKNYFGKDGSGRIGDGQIQYGSSGVEFSGTIKSPWKTMAIDSNIKRLESITYIYNDYLIQGTFTGIKPLVGSISIRINVTGNHFYFTPQHQEFSHIVEYHKVILPSDIEWDGCEILIHNRGDVDARVSNISASDYINAGTIARYVAYLATEDASTVTWMRLN